MTYTRDHKWATLCIAALLILLSAAMFVWGLLGKFWAQTLGA